MTDNAEVMIRVLIVDDIAETRENIRKLLQFESDVVVVGAARTGIEAIEMARETEPDVVIMDINMPDMDGFEATRLIRQDGRFRKLPIIAMTAHTMAGDRDKCLAVGMNDYVPKPIDSELLFKAIGNAVGGGYDQVTLSVQADDQV